MTRRGLLVTSLAQFGFPLFAEPAQLHWITLNSTGAVRDANWPDSATPIAVGSLLKPFLALAFLANHRQAPVIECGGIADGCWRPGGHGRQDIVAALANSCNVYFSQLAAVTDRAALDAACLSYGLSCPPRTWTPSRLIGLDGGWPQAPISVARAFAALGRGSRNGAVRTVLAGMAQCAESGTGRALALPCFAKTGTACCVHAHNNLVDGYVVAIYPMDQPRHIILASRHNTTGAHTARFIKRIADGMV